MAKKAGWSRNRQTSQSTSRDIRKGASRFLFEHELNEFHEYGKRKRTNDDGRVPSVTTGNARQAEGRDGGNQRGWVGNDQAGGHRNEHPESGDEGRRKGGCLHSEPSDEGKNNEEKVTYGTGETDPHRGG